MNLKDIDFCDRVGMPLSIGDTIEWYSKNAKRFRNGKILRVTIKKTSNGRYGRYRPSVLRCTYHVSGGIVLYNTNNIKRISVADGS